jgi:8-oxo-dGTP pyrophosphatase MutT (NUDIX family)
VFPGGRVDSDDTADPAWCDGLDHAARSFAAMDAAEAVSYHVGAARELFEEAGILLARDRSGAFVSLAAAADHERFTAYRRDVHAHRRTLAGIAAREDLRLALDALTAFAHWVTPPVEGRRFDTRFFVARLPPGQRPAHDDTETTDSLWSTPAAAMNAAERREIVLPPPTWMTMRELEPFRTVEAVVDWAASHRSERREPRLVQENGTRVLVMPDERTQFVWTDGYWRPERIER